MKVWRYFVVVFIGLVIGLFLTRLILPSQLDDVSPKIPCEENLMEWADVYYVIPKFENVSISENREWCGEILERKMATRGIPSELRTSNEVLSLSGKLAMHGIYHEYEEFRGKISLENLEEGMGIFKECFGFEPERFKPPQISISSRNKKLVRERMELDLFWNQLFHKVYHCGDTGIFPNWVVRVF